MANWAQNPTPVPPPPLAEQAKARDPNLDWGLRAEKPGPVTLGGDAEEVKVEVTSDLSPDAEKQQEPVKIEVEVAPEPVKAAPIPNPAKTVNVGIKVGVQDEVAVEDPPPITIELLTKEQELAMAAKDKAAQEAIKAKVEAEKLEPVKVEASKAEQEIKVLDKDGNVVRILIKGPDGKITIKPTPEAEKVAPITTEAEIAQAKEKAIAEEVAKLKAEAEEKAKVPVENDEQNSIVYDPAGKAIGQYDPKTQKVVLWAEQAKADVQKKGLEEEAEAIKVEEAQKEAKAQALLVIENEAKAKKAREKEAIDQAVERAKVKAIETGQKVLVTMGDKTVAEMGPDGEIIKPEVVAKNITVEEARAKAEAEATAKIEEEKKVDIVVQPPDAASLETQIQKLEAETARRAALNPAEISPVEETEEKRAINAQCEDLKAQLNKARQAGDTTGLFAMQERLWKVQDELSSTQDRQRTLQDERQAPVTKEMSREETRMKQQAEYSKESALHRELRPLVSPLAILTRSRAGKAA